MDYQTGNEFGMNSEYLNSILQKLSRLDEEMAFLKDLLRECTGKEGDTKTQKDELDADINNEVEGIKNELYAKLHSMIDSLKDHQISQQGEALKINQEIATLKKEKLDLYQKINELQKRITDMEMTIGQDPNPFQN